MTRNSNARLRDLAETIPSVAAAEKVQHRDGIHGVVYELGTYQAELEAQNEDLRRIQHELTAARDRYKAHFDHAPVGYLTVDSKNMILQVNLLAGKLFGTRRQDLVGKNLISLISKKDMDVLFVHLRRAARSNETQSCEVVLAKTNEDLSVRLNSQRVEQDRLPDPKTGNGNWTILIVISEVPGKNNIGSVENE